jgi:hypothetical protein
MFRKASGYRTQCGSLMLFVASDFDEWLILVQGPRTIIRGGRAFSEAKAKEQALQVANEYFAENGEDPAAAEPEWVALESGEWLNWRA